MTVQRQVQRRVNNNSFGFSLYKSQAGKNRKRDKEKEHRKYRAEAIGMSN